MKVLSIAILLFLVQAGGLPIDSLVPCLIPAKKITVTNLKGEFRYYESYPETGVYKSVFTGNNEVKLRYLHYSNGFDSLVVNDASIQVPEKYDALTIKSYKINFKGNEYLCLLSNSISASGSGSQVVYYSLLQMSNGEVKNINFFNSRFGTIQNIGDVDNDGQLDFLKISNTGQISKNEGRREIFKGEICKIDGTSLGKNYVKMEYLGNNNFKLIESKWFFEINCK